VSHANKRSQRAKAVDQASAVPCCLIGACEGDVMRDGAIDLRVTTTGKRTWSPMAADADDKKVKKQLHGYDDFE